MRYKTKMTNGKAAAKYPTAVAASTVATMHCPDSNGISLIIPATARWKYLRKATLIIAPGKVISARRRS